MSSKKVLYSVASAAAFVGLVWLLCRETPQAPPPHVQKKHIRPSNDKAYDECTRALQIPKVALLFLAHQDIQQKPVWRSWLKQAVRVVPSALLYPHLDVNSTHFHRVVTACRTVGRHYTQPHRQQMLFSLYLHNSPDAGRVEADGEHQLKHRIHTQWGSITLVEAERRLLQTALKDPLNTFFTMMSDTSIPLYPPLVVYQQLLVREVSAINACPLFYNPFALQEQYDSWHRMDWYGLTNETILPREKWRKSEQWFGLLRHHAEIVASEHNQLWHYMLENCPLNNLDGTGAEKFCILDEHFPAVALAVEGRDKETDCYGHLHFTEWREGEIHPVLWEGDELTVENISKMRAGWYSDAHNCRHLIHSPPPIDPLYFIWLDAYESPAALASALEHPDRRVAAASEPARLHPYCPMFARKFPESVSRRVLHLLKQPPLRVVASNASEGVRLYNSVAAQQQA